MMVRYQYKYEYLNIFFYLSAKYLQLMGYFSEHDSLNYSWNAIGRLLQTLPHPLFL